MNHGIADAVVLVKEITAAVQGNQSIQSAVDSYQKEMLDRAGEETRISITNTEMLHDWKRFLDSPILQRGGHPNEQQKGQASFDSPLARSLMSFGDQA